MILKETTRLELPAAADMHVHLRQGKMMELVVPQIRKGGVDTVFVMVRPAYFWRIWLWWLTANSDSPTWSLPLPALPRRWSTRRSCRPLSRT
jgi:hypothetical protein